MRRVSQGRLQRFSKTKTRYLKPLSRLRLLTNEPSRTLLSIKAFRPSTLLTFWSGLTSSFEAQRPPRRWFEVPLVALWVAFVVLVLLLNGIGGVAQFSQLTHPTLPPCTHAPSIYQLCKDQAAVLAGLHVDIRWYAAYIVAIEGLFVLAFVGIACGVIGRVLLNPIRKNTWLHVFVSITFLAFSTVTGLTQPLKIPAASGNSSSLYQVWHWPAAVVQTIATICCLLIFFLVPSGTFVPRWTRWAALSWTLINMLWLVAPLLPFWVPFDAIYPVRWGRDLPGSLIVAILCFLIGLYAQFQRWRGLSSDIERQQGKGLFLSLVSAVMGAGLLYGRELPSITHHQAPLGLLYLIVTTALFFVVFVSGAYNAAVSLLWSSPMQRDSANRLLFYSMLTMLIITVVLPVLLVIALLVKRLFFPASPGTAMIAPFLGLSVAVTVFILRILDSERHRIRYWAPNRVEGTERIQQFAHDLSNYANDVQLLARVLANQTARLIKSKHSIIYLPDEAGKLQPVAGYRMASLGLDRVSDLPLTLDDWVVLKASRAIERPRDSLFTLLLPLDGLSVSAQSPLTGILVFGPPRSGRFYTRTDRNLLLSLARQGGNWLSHAQLLKRERDRLGDLIESQSDTAGDLPTTLAKQLQGYPETPWHELQDLATAALHGNGTEIFEFLVPNLKKLHADDDLIHLVEGFRRLIHEYQQHRTMVSDYSFTEMVSALQLITEALASDTTDTDLPQREPSQDDVERERALIRYRTYLEGLQTTTVKGLAELLPMLAATKEQLVRVTPNNVSVSFSGNTSLQDASTTTQIVSASPPIIAWSESDCLAMLCEIAVLSQYVSTTRTDSARQAALQGATEQIEDLLTQLDAAATIQSSPSSSTAYTSSASGLWTSLEQLVIRCVASHWKDLCMKDLNNLLAATRLEFALLANVVVLPDERRQAPQSQPFPRVDLSLDIVNHGPRPVENVTSRLVPNELFRAISEPNPIEFIGPTGRPVTVPWAIEMFTTLFDDSQVELRPRFEVTYREQGVEKFILYEGQVQLQVAPPVSRLNGLKNPYVRGSPLGTNHPVFVGRSNLIELLRQDLENSPLIVLTGQRRTGKTSLLKQLEVRLGDSYCPVYFSCQGQMDPGVQAFLFRLSRAICEAVKMPPWNIAAFSEHPGTVFELEFLPQVKEALGEKRLLLLVDEFEKLEELVHDDKLDRDLFPYLRDLLQHRTGLAAIFAGGHQLEELDATCWSSFFNIAVHQHLGLLSRSEAEELIHRPVKHAIVYEPMALGHLIMLTGGHPYFLQLLCYALVQRAQLKECTHLRVEDIIEAVADVEEQGIGDGGLRSIWDEISEDERVVLQDVSQWLSVEELTARQVNTHLQGYGIELSEVAITLALHHLARRDILKDSSHRAPDAERTYRWKVKLIGMWVEKIHPLMPAR